MGVTVPSKFRTEMTAEEDLLEVPNSKTTPQPIGFHRTTGRKLTILNLARVLDYIEIKGINSKIGHRNLHYLLAMRWFQS